MPEMQPSEYVAATAIITNATLKMSIARSWPHLQEEDRDVMFIEVLDRMARLWGWSIRREPVLAEDDGE
jgi:hypothetical protein